MNQVDKIVAQLLSFLKVSQNMEMLPDIIQKLDLEYQKQTGENRAIVTSAVPLDRKKMGEIEKQLYKIFKRKLEIVNKVNPEIVAGFLVQVADQIIDLSLESYISDIEKNLKNETN